MSEECERNDYFLVVFDGKTNDKMNGYDHGIHRSVMSRSIPTENISTAQRSWGNTHTQKRTVKREKKRENNTTTTSNGFYVHIRYILCSRVCVCVCVGGLVRYLYL